MKILLVGDQHLYPEELGMTKGMVENSELIMEQVYNTILNDVEIKIVIFMGDLQHKTPTGDALYYISRWKKWMRKIGTVMSDRQPSMRINQRDIDYKDIGAAPVFSLLGNHDIKHNVYLKGEAATYTLFDSFLEEGLMQNPRSIIFKDAGQGFYLQFNNYGEGDKEIPETIANNDRLIRLTVCHDTFITPFTERWALQDKHAYSSVTAFKDSDYSYTGHIHEPMGPITIDLENGKTCEFHQTGAMARTDSTANSMRDYGHSVIIDTTSGVPVTEHLQIPLMTAEDYFAMDKVIINRKKKIDKQQRENYSLSLGEYVMTTSDPITELSEMDLEPDVKQNCVEIIEKIIEDNNKK